MRQADAAAAKSMTKKDLDCRDDAKLKTNDGKARFLEEARTTESFNHPNIVAIYGVGEHKGQPYVALE